MDATFNEAWTIYTTPAELRAIADRMEVQYPKIGTGQSLVVHTEVLHNKNSTVRLLHFAVDQDRIAYNPKASS